MIPGLGKFSYEETLELMDLSSFAYGRLGGIAVKVYLRGIYKDDSSNMLPLTSSQTRGHFL